MTANSHFRWLLLPFSACYGIGVWIRNILFNLEILPSERFDIPVLSVGNITVGGTGKTPMTEYLARLLGKEHQVAILSRGYKRKTKGFYLANQTSGLKELGDESLQLRHKFPKLTVAVDEDRREGIKHLCEKATTPSVDVVLLDDAYQHRYVQPGISILLIDYNRLINEDHLLPVGNLREPASQFKRAHILVFTKCPKDMKPIDRRLITMKFKIYTHQTLFFTTMEYSPLKRLETEFPTPLATEIETSETGSLVQNESEMDALTMEKIRDNQLPVLIVAGIASPKPFIDYVRSYCPKAQALLFPDHHVFSNKEIHNLQVKFESIRLSGGVILTTEKDSMRMLENPLFKTLSHHIYYPGVSIRFIDEGAIFDKKILDYVRINKRNRRMAQTTDVQPS
ncbi:MAG: tetraacyldisaccharide 4'-kinase [Bacteroidota bacterium]|nr:tetraacyldisaccharide 4'-kinase [Bacteroidota bacterium]